MLPMGSDCQGTSSASNDYERGDPFAVAALRGGGLVHWPRARHRLRRRRPQLHDGHVRAGGPPPPLRGRVRPRLRAFERLRLHLRSVALCVVELVWSVIALGPTQERQRETTRFGSDCDTIWQWLRHTSRSERLVEAECSGVVRCSRCRSGLDAQDECERLVYRSQLACVEPPGGSTQSLRVDDGRLFDNDSRLAPVEGDRGPEARRAGTSRRGRDERCREIQELVGLHYHRVAGSTLLVPSGTSRRRQMEHLASDHFSPPAVAQARPSVRG